jgi:hypothetical protein
MMSIASATKRRVAKRYSRTVTPVLSEQLANRLRALLRAADHPSGGSGTAGEWRESRDRWIDRLDPRNGLSLDDSDLRELIDFFSEAGPSRASRRTPAEWSRQVDALVPELLFAGRPSQPKN